MYITVLYMLLLKGHLCIPADFPIGCFFYIYKSLFRLVPSYLYV